MAALPNTSAPDDNHNMPMHWRPHPPCGLRRAEPAGRVRLHPAKPRRKAPRSSTLSTGTDGNYQSSLPSGPRDSLSCNASQTRLTHCRRLRLQLQRLLALPPGRQRLAMGAPQHRGGFIKFDFPEFETVRAFKNFTGHSTRRPVGALTAGPRPTCWHPALHVTNCP